MNSVPPFMQNALKQNNFEEVVIIGAGPAGLSCALELKSLGIDATLLESGEKPGQSWLDMPESLKLGPWISSFLGQNVPWQKLFIEPSAKEFASYLLNFACSNNLKIIANQKVSSIHKIDGGFSVITEASNVLKAICVVNATGYFRNPHFPEWVNSYSNHEKLLHFSNYKSKQKVFSSNSKLKILVVGSGISAGEVIMELVNTPHEISLSARSIIKYEQPKWLQLLVSPIYFWLESRMPIFKTIGSSKRFMAGGKTKKVIESNRVNHIGPILGVKGDCIRHASGIGNFDLIILATGWKSNLKHLNAKLLKCDGEPLVKNFQSNVWPGLFFLGFDNLSSFRSRFIRGIREDAKKLASEIQNYIQHRQENTTRI